MEKNGSQNVQSFDPYSAAKKRTVEFQKRSRNPYNPDPMRPKNSVNASSLTPGCSSYGYFD